MRISSALLCVCCSSCSRSVTHIVRLCIRVLLLNVQCTTLHLLQVLARNAAWSAEMLAAVRTQSTEAVMSVLAHTSLPRSRYTSACAALQIAEPAPFFLEVRGQGRVTPLALAAARNDLNAVSTTSSSDTAAACACSATA
jgi:hypothetical protein